jgi:hypothetical protein
MIASDAARKPDISEKWQSDAKRSTADANETPVAATATARLEA